MAGPERITDLTPLTSSNVASNDLFVIVDTSEGVDKSITVQEASSRFTSGGATAAGVTYSPTGSIASANVQDAVAEVATEYIAADLAISQSLTTTSTQLSLTSNAVTTAITNIATNLTALNTTAAVVSGHIASTTVVHGIADTATLLRTTSIGVSVQAFDTDLSALAGVTSAADKVPYFTGSGTADVASFTSFGRSLVADTNAAAAIATIGLGTAASSASTDFLPILQTIRTVTTTNYTMVQGDVNNIILMNTATNQVVIPAGTFSTGVRVDIIQYGTGATTITGGGTTTVHVRSGLNAVTNGKYAVTSWVNAGSNEWIGGGDVTGT